MSVSRNLPLTVIRIPSEYIAVRTGYGRNEHHPASNSHPGNDAHANPIGQSDSYRCSGPVTIGEKSTTGANQSTEFMTSNLDQNHIPSDPDNTDIARCTDQIIPQSLRNLIIERTCQSWQSTYRHQMSLAWYKLEETKITQRLNEILIKPYGKQYQQ